jgi:sortase A
MKKIIPCLMMLIGLFIIAYPVLKEKYIDYKSDEILKAIEDGYYYPISIPTVDDENTDQQTDNIISKINIETGQPIGIIKISKINIKYPILEGSSLNIMKVAVGHVKDTKLPGQYGNCALAAHRSFTYGRFFNRLDELKNGDIVEITTRHNKYKYTIFDKKRVLPDDTSVLNSEKGTHYLTLITCDPMRNPTHRLILVGKLQ